MTIRHFDHIDLRVRNKAEARPFYEKVMPLLGFPFVEEGEWLCFGSRQYPEIGEYVAVTEEPTHVAPNVCIAFWCDSKAEVDHLAALLQTIDVPAFEAAGMHYKGHYACYFEDPSGNRFEICHRNYSPAFDGRISERSS